MHHTAFLEHLEFEKRFSSHTLTAYRSDLNQFSTFLSDLYQLTSIKEVKHTHIRSWMVQLMQNKVQSRSINRKLSCLKTFFKYLQKRGFLDKNPMQKVIAPKMGKRLPTFVHRQKLESMFKEVDFGEDYAGARNRMILELLYGTGMRRSELIGLEIGDIDLQLSKLRVLGKGNKERIIPINAHLQELIGEYLEIRMESFGSEKSASFLLTDKGSKLYPKFVYNIVNRYLSLVTTIEQRSPHVLRHSFATHLSGNGADLNAIKGLLGHASLAATQVYTHNSIERLQEVYKQAHPKAQKD